MHLMAFLALDGCVFCRRFPNGLQARIESFAGIRKPQQRKVTLTQGDRKSAAIAGRIPRKGKAARTRSRKDDYAGMDRPTGQRFRLGRVREWSVPRADKMPRHANVTHRHAPSSRSGTN